MEWNWVKPLLLGMELVLGLEPGVRVFAPQYSTWKAGVLGQRWYLSICWFEAIHMLKTPKNSIAMENLMLKYSKILCKWNTSPVMQLFFGSFTWTNARLVILGFYKIPDTGPEFAFSYPFHPNNITFSLLHRARFHTITGVYPLFVHWVLN